VEGNEGGEVRVGEGKRVRRRRDKIRGTRVALLPQITDQFKSQSINNAALRGTCVGTASGISLRDWLKFLACESRSESLCEETT
jgi:hypothetical protein